MKKGKERGCKILNGHEMLRFQAEKSLELWVKTFKIGLKLFFVNFSK